jgi:cell division GTPase FtsZ
MKMVVVGIGQCGGRLADELLELNSGMKTITGAFAVNTDEADLSGLWNIPSDYQHRILLGGRKTGGHGVGKINEVGAQLARENSDKIIDALRVTSKFYETDAFLVMGSTAGGTGSGSMPVIVDIIKQRYRHKPVYALAVLPFEHEETAELRSVYNTATCLKSVYAVADAVFIADNQRYLRKDSSLLNNMVKINRQIVAPFRNLLAAGEQTKRKNIGARVVDAGDIIQTLGGWTTIGLGKSEVGLFRPLVEKKRHFRRKSTETHKGLHALDEALSELSLGIRTEDARSAMFLLSAPSKEMNLDIVKELGDYLKELSPNAMIRGGDFPKERGDLNVTVIMSQLCDVDRITQYYDRLEDIIPQMKQMAKEAKVKTSQLEKKWANVPILSGENDTMIDE